MHRFLWKYRDVRSFHFFNQETHLIGDDIGFSSGFSKDFLFPLHLAFLETWNYLRTGSIYYSLYLLGSCYHTSLYVFIWKLDFNCKDFLDILKPGFEDGEKPVLIFANSSSFYSRYSNAKQIWQSSHWTFGFSCLLLIAE